MALQVKLHGSCPALPRLKELTAVLKPLHAAVQLAMGGSHRWGPDVLPISQARFWGLGFRV